VQLAVITKAKDIASMLLAKYHPACQEDGIGNFLAITLAAILCGRSMGLNRDQFLDVVALQWAKFQTMESVMADIPPATSAVN